MSSPNAESHCSRLYIECPIMPIRIQLSATATAMCFDESRESVSLSLGAAVIRPWA